METWITFAERLGFPALVALLVLVRLDGSLRRIHTRLTELCLLIGETLPPGIAEKCRRAAGSDEPKERQRRTA